MKKPDYSTWLTKQQAADAIGVSTKQIERWAQEKRLQAARWKRPEGGPAIVVYHPDDVERIAKERNPAAQAFVMPAGADDGQADKGTAVAVRQPSPEQFIQALVSAMSQTSQNGVSQTSQTHPGVRLAERLFMTVAEAAEYTGLGVRHIRKQIEDGKLKSLKGAGPRGADVLRRADLESL